MLQKSRAFLPCLGLALSVVACSTLPQTPPTTRDLTAHAAALAAEVSQIRSLAIKEQVPVGVKDRPGVRSAYQQLIDEEWGDHDEGTSLAYKLFGLLPQEMEVKSYLIDLYAAQVGGYYDPKKSEFFVVETPAQDSPKEELASRRNFVVAHELVHALQDQHFDLEAIRERFRRQNDRGLASAAVMEGDATLAAFDHLVWQQVGCPLTMASPLGRRLVSLLSAVGERIAVAGNSPEARELREAPDVLRTEILFAYLAGMVFISTVRAEFGWEGVDAVFRDLPDSTEQILHPERYIDRRDRPHTVELAEAPAGWEPVFTETLGMLVSRVLLREHLGKRAERAAEGWDGDRYAVWETPAGAALGWVTVWDRPYQAWRFERTYRRLLKRKLGPEGRFAVLRRGHLVAAVEGGLPGEAETAADRLLASRIERPADDAPPDGPLERWLRWPVSVRKLDRVFETALLGGHLFHLRGHARGHQLSLLRGWLGRSERSPDRRRLSTALGLVWGATDRNHAYRAWGLAPLLDFHTRGTAPERRYAIGLGRLPLLGPVFSLRRDTYMMQVSLLRGFALRIRWGTGVRTGERLRIFWIPIPGV